MAAAASRRPGALLREARAALRSRASARVKEGAERYFKGAVPFHGVPNPAVRALARELWTRVADLPVETLEREAHALLRAPFFEEKFLAASLLQRAVRRLDAGSVARLEAPFDDGVAEWGTCDALAGHVLRPLVARDAAARRRVVAWSRARGTWRRRAAAVAFVSEARHGRCAAEILAIAGRLVKGDERFEQLGLGWVLRDLWRHEPAAVEGFLRAHLPRLRREALRYAIEKMPAALQRRLLDEHAAAAPRRGRRAAKSD